MLFIILCILHYSVITVSQCIQVKVDKWECFLSCSYAWRCGREWSYGFSHLIHRDSWSIVTCTNRCYKSLGTLSHELKSERLKSYLWHGSFPLLFIPLSFSGLTSVDYDCWGHYFPFCPNRGYWNTYRW